MIGRLYYDNDKNKSLEDKLHEYIQASSQKSNILPNIVEINKNVYNDAGINWYLFELRGIKIRPSKYVMKNCFFIGWEE